MVECQHFVIYHYICTAVSRLEKLSYLPLLASKRWKTNRSSSTQSSRPNWQDHKQQSMNTRYTIDWARDGPRVSSKKKKHQHESVATHEYSLNTARDAPCASAAEEIRLRWSWLLSRPSWSSSPRPSSASCSRSGCAAGWSPATSDTGECAATDEEKVQSQGLQAKQKKKNWKTIIQN